SAAELHRVCSSSLPGRDDARAFLDGHERAGIDRSGLLFPSAGPRDVHGFDTTLAAKTEMYPKIALRKVASSAVNLLDERPPVHLDGHPRPHRIAVALAADERDRHRVRS